MRSLPPPTTWYFWSLSFLSPYISTSFHTYSHAHVLFVQNNELEQALARLPPQQRARLLDAAKKTAEQAKQILARINELVSDFLLSWFVSFTEKSLSFSVVDLWFMFCSFFIFCFDLVIDWLCCFVQGPAVGSEAERQKLLQQAKNLANTIAALGRELQTQGVQSPAVAERLNNLQVCTSKTFLFTSHFLFFLLLFLSFLFYYWNLIAL